jgi:hypothetical protein
MIIAALLAFGALLACWLFAAPEPDADRHASAPAAEPGAHADPDLATGGLTAA